MRLTNASATAGRTALRLLFLEDSNRSIDNLLPFEMKRFGFETAAIGKDTELKPYLQNLWPDVVVLNIAAPASGHFDLTRRLRRQMNDVGIVVLAGQGNMADKISALTAGADTYLSKPVETEFLAATLYSLARRLPSFQPESHRTWRVDADGWCLLSPSGSMVDLTKAEGRVLARLLEKHNRSVSRNELIEMLAANIYDFDPHRLDSLIHRLRKKVLRVTGETLPLNTVYGEGYVFLLI